VARQSTGQRPLIAIIGINDATETTDYLMPYGVPRFVESSATSATLERRSLQH
jgi:hypothetical protein